MSEENISTDQLQGAAKRGEQFASDALTKMAGKKVSVETAEARMADSSEIKSAIGDIGDGAVVAYTQAVTGVEGVSIIAIDRDKALGLVDLLNGRDQGTTVVMQEIDRSTIRETLNILANAYVTELANETKKLITLTVPRMVTTNRMEDLMTATIKHPDKKAVLFKTRLKVDDLDFEVDLYFHFYFLAS